MTGVATHTPVKRSALEATSCDTEELAVECRAIEAAFQLSGHASLRQVRLRCEPGHLIMEGTVHRYFDRQISLSIARKVAPGRQVVDRIIVQSAG